MRRRLLLDLEQGAPEVLDDLDDALFGARLRKPKLGARADHDEFAFPDEHRSAARRRQDEVARTQRRASRGGQQLRALAQLHDARHLAHPPRSDRGQCRIADDQAQEGEDKGGDTH
ncbi:MAG TPA: hypothetical protein VF662_01090 [Allosphingosinicella sp.]|jgi:hypothetical protein